MSRGRIKIAAVLTLVTWVLLLGACSTEVSGADQIGIACQSQLDMPDEACECLSGEAQTRLSEPAAVWLATAMSGDTEKAKVLKENVPWTELVEASMFMITASQACALELDEEGLPDLG